MNFVRDADLGFRKEAVLVVNANTDSAVQSKQESYKQKLLQIPGVTSVSFSSDVPSSDNNSATNFGFDHKPDPLLHCIQSLLMKIILKRLALKCWQAGLLINQIRYMKWW